MINQSRYQKKLAYKIPHSLFRENNYLCSLILHPTTSANLLNRMLIAESGSTKTEWRLIKKGEIVSTFRSSGVNPNVLEPEAITEILQTAFRHYLQEKNFKHVFFYGAGLSAASQKEIIRNVLQGLLPDKTIHVEHDMTAAARSTHREKGIVCILGTGSNSALHEDFQITGNLGGHGYMFGDEGSGADLGKHFIKHLLQDDFPASVKEFVEGEKGAPVYEQKIQIMKSERPNVDLAEYSVLISKQIHVQEVRKMVYDRFIAFLDTTVCRYAGYEDITADFVGSISFFFQNILEQACKDRNVQLGSIVKDPVDNLIAYHLDRIKEDSL